MNKTETLLIDPLKYTALEQCIHTSEITEDTTNTGYDHLLDKDYIRHQIASRLYYLNDKLDETR